MKALIATTALILGLAALPTLAGEVYQWTDDNGVTHFGERPPSGVDAKQLRPITGRSTPADYSQHDEQPEADEQQGEQGSLGGARVHHPDPERCEAARNNLEIMSGDARIEVVGEDGEPRFLEPDERQQQIERMERIIEANC